MSEHAESDVAQEQDDDELVKRKEAPLSFGNGLGSKSPTLTKKQYYASGVGVLF